MANALLRKSMFYYMCKLTFHWVENWLDLICIYGLYLSSQYTYW